MQQLTNKSHMRTAHSTPHINKSFHTRTPTPTNHTTYLMPSGPCLLLGGNLVTYAYSCILYACIYMHIYGVCVCLFYMYACTSVQNTVCACLLYFGFVVLGHYCHACLYMHIYIHHHTHKYTNTYAHKHSHTYHLHHVPNAILS